jgi:hypothetical protein
MIEAIEDTDYQDRKSYMLSRINIYVQCQVTPINIFSLHGQGNGVIHELGPCAALTTRSLVL